MPEALELMKGTSALGENLKELNFNMLSNSKNL